MENHSIYNPLGFYDQIAAWYRDSAFDHEHYANSAYLMHEYAIRVTQASNLTRGWHWELWPIPLVVFRVYVSDEKKETTKQRLELVDIL